MFVEEFLGSLIGVLTYQCVGVAIFLPFELLFPKERIPFSKRAGGFIFLLATAPFMAAISTVMIVMKEAVGIRGIPLHFELAPIAASIALALWVDLQFYVVHRVEHRFLWRFHRVHHSIRNLSAANSFHHWTEPLWLALVLGLPLMFVDVQIGPTLGLLSAAFRFQQFYIHSASRPHFGPLRWLLVDNRYHRIHHSTDPAHHHRNFGAMTPFWDWLFGTLYMPKSDEWPEVGCELSEPRSLREWSSAPWRLGRKLPDEVQRADAAIATRGRVVRSVVCAGAVPCRNPPRQT